MCVLVGWQKDAFLSQIVCGISKIAAHISEIDVEDYISEMIETAPSEIIWDPDENYTVDMHHPATNWIFGHSDRRMNLRHFRGRFANASPKNSLLRLI